VQKKILAVAAAAGAAAQSLIGPPTLQTTIAVAGTLLREERARATGISSTATTEKTEEGKMPRKCSAAGCSKRLSSKLAASGKCLAHQSGSTKKLEPTSSTATKPAAEGHTHVPHSPGNGRPANGHAQPAHAKAAAEPKTTTTTTRTCAMPGCSVRLAHNNEIGLCQVHRPGAPAAAVVHAEASGGNGHAGNGHAANGHAQPSPTSNGHDVILEERISRAMSLIPIEERLAFLDRWLRAQA
jgi:hypothetical protein